MRPGAGAWVGLLLLLALSPAAAGAGVTVFLHVPLEANWRSDGSVPNDCNFSQPSKATLLPAWLRRRYDRTFAWVGATTESLGPGSWIGPAGLTFERDLHVTIRTTQARAQAFVPAFLRSSRRELHQHETLAEIAGASFAGGVRMKRVVATVPLPGSRTAGILQLHRIFDRYAGGASEYDDADGIHVAASTPLAAVAALQKALSQGGFAFTTTDSTVFVSSC